jgi:hypothetical protein
VRAVGLGRDHVVGARREHGLGGRFAGGDATRSGRAVGQRADGVLVGGVDQRLLRRQQARQRHPVRGGDGRDRAVGRAAPQRVVRRRLHDRHHAHGRRRADLRFGDQFAGLDVPVGDRVGARERRRDDRRGGKQERDGVRFHGWALRKKR